MPSSRKVTRRGAAGAPTPTPSQPRMSRIATSAASRFAGSPRPFGLHLTPRVGIVLWQQKRRAVGPKDESKATTATEAPMSSIKESAAQFFDACETGKGWYVCKEFCHPDAGFSAQAGALADVNTLESYTEWTKGLLTPVPDGRYELRSFAVDEDRHNVMAFSIFRGTHTGEGGPVPPTGNSVETDYV